MKLNVVIVEDEPATARQLKHLLLEADPAIEVMATLNTVAEAVQWFKNNNSYCQLVLMDIQLSDGLSFEIFEAVEISAPVIFITAYNEYALKAFKANGIDYILKPVDAEELNAALHKFKKLKGEGPVAGVKSIQQVLGQIKVQSGYKRSFLVHYRDKLIPLSAVDIKWFYTQNETVHAAVEGGTHYIIEDTLEKLQVTLDPAQFFRANRQFIVNRAAILEAGFYFNGRLILKVHPVPKEHILISKARVPEFKEWMNM